MRVLQYKGLNPGRLRNAFGKIKAAIEADDFRSADVKKLNSGGYYRAKLDYANRLLLRFARVPIAGGPDETVCLALEIIENHAYERSRFLRGAQVDFSLVESAAAALAGPATVASDATSLRWAGRERTQFELLDKPIVFDDDQDRAVHHPAPLVLIGSAGSGKTAVTVARLRETEGQVLYVTHSAYLAQSARSLYGSHGFESTSHEIEFLSYGELLQTLRVPKGQEVSLKAFSSWFDRHRQTVRQLGEIDAQALFEEFRGVIGAQPDGPLSLEAYQLLGSRQSLLAPNQRETAHHLFQRYVAWLEEAGLHDSNLIAHAWRRQIAEVQGPVYDFVVVDEVQDMTPVQLALILALLKKPGQFILCGDSHQIVHPNFFSWAALKTMFWQGLAGELAQRQPLHLLQANFRNTQAVTALANCLLKIKQARFGSVDRESSFLVRSTATEAGDVRLVDGRAATLEKLDAATQRSARHAVIVLRDEDKAEARKIFRTPLLFSVHEAKGLEYPNVILFALISGERSAYQEVCEGVSQSDLESGELQFRRARDKSDKSLEIYKFYVNALYVAMTRAVESLTLIERDTEHPLLTLLGLEQTTLSTQAVTQSSREEWAQEARKLELQGKAEQAQAIRDQLLQHKPVPWTPWSRSMIEGLLARALDARDPSTKPRQTLFDYAIWHGQQEWLTRLAGAQFAAARTLMVEGDFCPPIDWQDEDRSGLSHRNPYIVTGRLVRQVLDANQRRVLQPYQARHFKDLLRQCDVHGPDHATPQGATPLMLAAQAGNAALVEALLAKGADPQKRDEFGQTAWDQLLARAMRETPFARDGIAALFDTLAPATIDVQIDERLVRLERRQAEYWILSLMLAGLKTQWSRCHMRDDGSLRYLQGFFAAQFLAVLEQLPAWLWSEARRKTSYVNHVLARAEVKSTYAPARKLWVRTQHGHYLPNPTLLLRVGDGWQRVTSLFAIDWIDQGCRTLSLPFPGPADAFRIAEAMVAAPGAKGRVKRASDHSKATPG